MGAVVTRHFSRLMPLLLRWLHASGSSTKAAAVTALRIVLLNSWPRIPAHAPLLWQHLQVRVVLVRVWGLLGIEYRYTES